jgi:hypothetical protein
VADPLESPIQNFYRTLFELLEYYNKKNWSFKFGLTSFPSKKHENRQKIHKNRLIDETINRLIFWKIFFLSFLKW